MNIIHKNPRFHVTEIDIEQNSNCKTHYFVQKRDAVLVIVTCEEMVLVLHNSRPLISANSVELPGGAIDVEEEPLSAAYRELKEETSIDSICLEPFALTFPLPSLVSEKVYIYRGRLSSLPDLNVGHEAAIEGISKYSWIAIDRLDSFLSEGKVDCAVDAYALSLLFMEELKR